MAVVFTFDIANGPAGVHNRIQSAFQRLGWENLGGSVYRYPRLGTDDQPVEDWFNHVIPALMLFRALTLNGQLNVTKFTLDVVSSSGFSSATQYGQAPLAAAQIQYYQPGNQQFGHGNLVQWLDDVTAAYPY